MSVTQAMRRAVFIVVMVKCSPYVFGADVLAELPESSDQDNDAMSSSEVESSTEEDPFLNSNEEGQDDLTIMDQPAVVRAKEKVYEKQEKQQYSTVKPNSWNALFHRRHSHFRPLRHEPDLMGPTLRKGDLVAVTFGNGGTIHNAKINLENENGDYEVEFYNDKDEVVEKMEVKACHMEKYYKIIKFHAQLQIERGDRVRFIEKSQTTRKAEGSVLGFFVRTNRARNYKITAIIQLDGDNIAWIDASEISKI